MSVPTRRLISLAAVGAALLLPRGDAAAQVGTFDACSQGPLANCASVRLTSELGIGPGGINFFEIALRNLGSQSTPLVPTSIYYMVLSTGHAVADPGAEVDALVTPGTAGGATVTDAAAWSVYETGDAIFLAALGGDGIGGCAASAPVDGWGQMGNTCGSDDYITFQFFTPRAFDLNQFTLAYLETVAIADGNAGESCGVFTSACDATAITVTPEPGTMLLALTGFSAVVGARRRRRAAVARAAGEA